MATVAPAPFERRKKQHLYGKSHRVAYNKSNAAFFDDEEDELALPAPKKVRTNTSVARPVKAQEAPSVTVPAPQPKRVASPVVEVPRPRQQADTFDVPSSDDEDAMGFAEVPAVPRRKIKSQLISEPVEETEKLAPWEKRALSKTAPASSATRGKRDGTAPTGARLKASPRKPTTEMKSAPRQARQEDDMSVSLATKAASGLTAKEKLAARRRQNHSASAAQTDTESVDETPAVAERSAPSVTAQTKPYSGQRRMTQPVQPTETNIQSPAKKDASTADDSIFDVPSDEDMKHTSKPFSPPSSASAISKIRSRLPARSARLPTPQKAVSAPTRLTAMLPAEDEHDFPADDDMRLSPDATSASRTNATSEQLFASSTPRSTRNTVSPGHLSGSLTPKQVQLWDDFFQTTASPSIGMKELSISESRRTAKVRATAARTLARSSSDVPVKRTRMVDRLKAAIVSSSDVEDSENSDEDATDHSMNETNPDTVDTAHESQEQTASQNQDHKPEIRTRRTYAKQRSHLAEDNAENAMLLDVPMETPQRPAAAARRVGRPAVVPKKSTFDIDDDDDAPAGGLRTIHELRAAGRTNRVMGEIEDLLSEVADHAASSKSRRRSALMDLATKLADKGFAEQFTGHGFESQLLAECNATSDPAADFLLAAALATVLSYELPAHTTQSCTAALPWLTKLLSASADIAKVAKDRRSNMSKAAQGDLMAFADKIKAKETLWSNVSPTTMTSHVLALKCIELLVSKLRAIGDRSELLDADALSALLPKSGFTGDQSNDQDGALEASLAISTLEALSTLSAISAWPQEVIGALATLPAAFAETWQAPQHTKWLAYRLCLNITNEKAIDFSLFVGTRAVQHLLQDVVNGFENLHQSAPASDTDGEESRALRLDLLLLAIGILINLAEYSSVARQQAVAPASLPALTSIIGIFAAGQERALEAESVEESAENVAFGYLAVMLANVCQDASAKAVVKGLLPKQKLDVLVEGVEEFVRHHQRVDAMTAMETEGGNVGEGAVWSGFTERLLGVLERLKMTEVGDA